MGGRVILLNGTSSAGKSSLARALQDALETPWIFLSADNVLGGYPFNHRGAAAEAPWRPLGRLFYETVALFATSGVDVVAEQVFQNPVQLVDAVEVLHELPLWFVGVRCDLAEAERREAQRGDGTKPGTARSQINKVHAHDVYDIEVDTTTTSSSAAAHAIIRGLETNPSAFQQLAVGRA